MPDGMLLPPLKGYGILIVSFQRQFRRSSPPFLLTANYERLRDQRSAITPVKFFRLWHIEHGEWLAFDEQLKQRAVVSLFGYVKASPTKCLLLNLLTV